MIRKLSVALALFALASCHPDETEVVCDPAPPREMSTLFFHLRDRQTGEDLLVNGSIIPDSVQVQQNCNNKTNYRMNVVEGMLNDDNSKTFKAFSFDSLKAKYINEGADCEIFYVQWNSGDVDTFQYSETGDGCTAPRVSVLRFNGQVINEQEYAFQYKGQTTRRDIFILEK